MKFADMKTTLKEDAALELWLRYLDEDQYVDLYEEAFEIATQQAYAEEAHENLLPVLVDIIERNLRERARRCRREGRRR